VSDLKTGGPSWRVRSPRPERARRVLELERHPAVRGRNRWTARRHDRRSARIIDFDVARDGGSFLINSEVTGPGNTPLNVIVNWTSTLKKA
jgi:hypothetical protein